MTKFSVHQLLPTINRYDAIGNEAIVIREILRKMGYNSEIYAENIHPSMKGQAKNYTEYNEHTNDVFIYHHSIGSGLGDFILSLKSKIIMIYHNITPPEFFDDTNAEISKLLRLGKSQLLIFKNKIDVAVGDSEYNRLELEQSGYKKTGILPILLEKAKYQKQADQDLIAKYKDYVNILYVGRIAPNKRVDEVIRAFSYYNYNINPQSHLFLVGCFDGTTNGYYQYLSSLVNSSKTKNVHFVTDANDDQLISFYKIADVFMTMSLHEGFCVPLVESMLCKVPIIAYDSTAIPYTLGDSGVKVTNETFEEIGELINIVATKSELRTTIVEKQTERFTSIYDKDNQSMISEILDLVL